MCCIFSFSGCMECILLPHCNWEVCKIYCGWQNCATFSIQLGLSGHNLNGTGTVPNNRTSGFLLDNNPFMALWSMPSWFQNNSKSVHPVSNNEQQSGEQQWSWYCKNDMDIHKCYYNKLIHESHCKSPVYSDLAMNFGLNILPIYWSCVLWNSTFPLHLQWTETLIGVEQISLFTLLSSALFSGVIPCFFLWEGPHCHCVGLSYSNNVQTIPAERKKWHNGVIGNINKIAYGQIPMLGRDFG